MNINSRLNGCILKRVEKEIKLKWHMIEGCTNFLITISVVSETSGLLDDNSTFIII